MDHADHDRGRLALGPLQGRVRELSRKLALRFGLVVPKARHLRKLKAVFLFGLAILFGTIACRLNREETELQWRQSHFPSAKVWAAGFASVGFRAVSNPTLVARVTRRLPALADTAGQIWKASPDWWAVETRDGTQPLLFCFLCSLKAVPAGWTPSGTGWDGWESAMDLARSESRELSGLLHPAKRSEKRREILDPREIRY